VLASASLQIGSRLAEGSRRVSEKQPAFCLPDAPNAVMRFPPPIRLRGRNQPRRLRPLRGQSARLPESSSRPFALLHLFQPPPSGLPWRRAPVRRESALSAFRPRRGSVPLPIPCAGRKRHCIAFPHERKLLSLEPDPRPPSPADRGHLLERIAGAAKDRNWCGGSPASSVRSGTNTGNTGAVNFVYRNGASACEIQLFSAENSSEISFARSGFQKNSKIDVDIHYRVEHQN
jgi:hypothetical protein